MRRAGVRAIPDAARGRGAGILLHPETTSYLEHHGLIDLGRVSSAARTLRYLTSDGDVLLEEPIAYRFTSKSSEGRRATSTPRSGDGNRSRSGSDEPR